MSLINKLYIRVFCQKIGEDKFGNMYYIGKNKNYLGHSKRYVIYSGIEESSKVPPMWHAWLHYLINELPMEIKNYDWQREHSPNLSGTKNAYNPSLSKCVNIKIYSSWNPK